MQACCGSFTVPLVTTSTPVTIPNILDAAGASFKPKAVIFLGSGPHGGGFAANFWTTVGFDDGVHHYSATGCEPAWGNFEADPYGNAYDSYSILGGHRQFGIFGPFRRAYISSLASGSFVVTVDYNDIPGDVLFLAVGGSDIQTAIGTLPQVGHGLSVTGLGFSPCAIFFMPVDGFSDSLGSNSFSQNFGFASAAGQATLNIASVLPNAVQLTLTARGLRTDGCIGVLDHQAGVQPHTYGGTVYGLASLDADGFTLSGAATPNPTAYLAIGSVSTSFQNITQPSIAGNVPYATGIPTRCGIFLSNSTVAGSGVPLDANWSVGFFDGRNQVSVWCGEPSQNPAPTDIATQYLSTAAVFTTGSAPSGAGSATIIGQAAVVSLNIVSALSANMVLNWMSVDSSGRQVVALLLGDGTGTCAAKFPAVPPPILAGCVGSLTTTPVQGAAGCADTLS